MQTLINFCARQYLTATKQLYKWYFPSVCPSVRHTFLTMFPSSYHHEILVFYVFITNDQSKVHEKDQGQRSQRSQPNLTVSGL